MAHQSGEKEIYIKNCNSIILLYSLFHFDTQYTCWTIVYCQISRFSLFEIHFFVLCYFFNIFILEIIFLLF